MRRALKRLALAPVLLAVLLADTFVISFCLVLVVVAVGGYALVAAAVAGVVMAVA